MFGQLVAQDLEDRLLRRFGCAVDHEAVGQASASTNRRLGRTADPDRHRPLDPEREDAGVVDPVPLAGVVDDLIPRQVADDVDLLLEPAGTVAEILVQALVLDLVPADADAETEFPAGEEVHRGGLLRDERGLALGKDDHAAGVLEGGRDGGHEREEREGLHEGILAGVGTSPVGTCGFRCADDVIVREDVIEPERFGLGRELSQVVLRAEEPDLREDDTEARRGAARVGDGCVFHTRRDPFPGIHALSPVSDDARPMPDQSPAWYVRTTRTSRRIRSLS